ncbi:MAG: hypothetical protein V1774_10205 [Candidatus Eisenbacteria bacterium]
MLRARWMTHLWLASMIAFCLTTCSNSSEPDVDNAHGIPATQSEYVVLAWNDLGMHCLNPTYDQAVLLPPYNTVWAQVIRRGNPPTVVTEGLTAEYRLVDNTSSYDKTDDLGAVFAGFWDHVEETFGVSLEHDTGLNLVEPLLHNGLSGTMVAQGDHFQVDGIPVTPVDDDGVWNPYQVVEIKIRSGETVVAQARATVPTSDEIHCSRCHGQGGEATEDIGGGGPDVFRNVLLIHDEESEGEYSPALVERTPVLCAGCHGSPALGTSGPGSSEHYLSEAIHGAHASRGATCYDCHPGSVTRCNRSLAHDAEDGHCTACHGSIDQVAGSIESGARIPWANEPMCSTCHAGVAGVDTGATLYRNAAGHGGVYCAACHHSPHAMHPSREASDRDQPLQLQQASVTIGSCATCHESSRGEGADEFAETHGGANGRVSACQVCHTQVAANTGQWPHAFQWTAR